MSCTACPGQGLATKSRPRLCPGSLATGAVCPPWETPRDWGYLGHTAWEVIRGAGSSAGLVKSLV